MFQYQLFLILAPISIVAMIGTDILALRYRVATGLKSFFWALLCITGYLIANLLELISPTITTTLIWAKLNYVFITMNPVTWLIFSLEYTKKTDWLSKQLLSILCIIPIITIVLVQTNEMHHLIWKNYSFIEINDMLVMKTNAFGSWFWVHAAYSYLLIVAGSFIIGRQYFVTRNLYRQQSILVVCAVTIPLVTNIIYVSHLLPNWSKDYSPVAFAVAAVLLTISILRYRLLDLAPIARDTLIDRMGSGLIVLDRSDRVIDINPSGLSSLNLTSQNAIGIKINEIHYLSGKDVLPEKSDEKCSEICIREAEDAPIYFEVRAIQLKDKRDDFLGHLVTLHDMTTYKQLLNKVEYLARTDVLTGIYNRRHLIEIAHHELMRSRRYKTPLSVMLIDIDHFKQINDRHGHQTGDIVLKDIANRLNSCLRTSDILARYGGDEFIILLPETSEQAAGKVAQRLLTVIGEKPIKGSNQNIHATLSIGICSISGNQSISLDRFLEYADSALYQSKVDGRNCSSIQHPESESSD